MLETANADAKGGWFYVDPAVIPVAMTYQWRDRGGNGWVPVPKDRHPAFKVKRGGLRLYEKRTDLVAADRATDFEHAMAQRNTAFERAILGIGLFGGTEGGRISCGFFNVMTDEVSSSPELLEFLRKKPNEDSPYRTSCYNPQVPIIYKEDTDV